MQLQLETLHLADEQVKLIVLGTAQDGGYPHTGCREVCCREAWNNLKLQRLVSSLAILSGNDCWLIDITPDFSYQLRMIETELNGVPRISGIFISHAHMGHYMGLMELGLEVMNTHAIPVYVMGKMKSFLEENAPFTQLIKLNNIKLELIEESAAVQLNEKISIMPFLVPHRNEFSETVGYSIQSARKKVLYIPDIDAWDDWEMDINKMIKKHDIALLDGTFYEKNELQSRNIEDVPHPSIKESIKRFSPLVEIDRKKVNFTHLNHTNKVLRQNSKERNEITSLGFQIASDGMIWSM